MYKKLITSNSPFEPEIGFSRAARYGNIIAVSGTAPINNDGSTAYRGDLYKQTKYCIEIIKQAIEQAGGKLENTIRTRIMLRDITKWKDAAKAHGEYFSSIRPASTFVEISKLINEDWLVEIEADCIVQ